MMKRAAIAIVFIVGVSILVALQGWGGRITSFDMIPHAMEAANLLKLGLVPNHGCLSSLGSYIPPGTSWLIAIGQVLFTDPRLEVVPGALLLHGLSILGVFCLARWCWSWKIGLCAALVFAFSPVSLKMAVNLWPRFPMAATVWFVLFLGKWSYEKRPWCLGAALVVLSLGLYVHMEGLLLVVAIPLAWVIFRPPLSIRPLLIATLLSVTVWWPYLRFEQSRGFVDLKSQVGMQSLFYQTPVLARVEAMAVRAGLPSPGTINDGLSQTPLSWKAKLLEKGDLGAQGCVRVANLIGVNFWAYGWSGIICSLIGGLLLAALIRSVLPVLRINFARMLPIASDTSQGERRSWNKAITGIGFMALLYSCLANEWVLSRLFSTHSQMGDYTIRSIRLVQGIAALVGMTLVCRKLVSGWIMRMASRPASPMAVVGVVFIPPWLVMAWMSSEFTPYRFWLFWPVLVVVLVGTVWSWLALVGEKWNGIKRVVSVTIVALLLFNPAVIACTKDWIANGWKSETPEVKALQSLAAIMQIGGGRETTIGYIMPFEKFMAYYNVLDVRYKVGLPYDWYLQSAFGIRNTRMTPEGVSNDDQYRLVENVVPSGNQVSLPAVSRVGWSKKFECGDYSCWIKDK